MSDAILLVEDNADDVLFLTRALHKAGVAHPLVVVSDGQAALDYFEGKDPYSDRSRHPLPSLVLLDLKLPLVPGLDVLRWLRSQPQFKSLIVVVLTSSDHPSDIKQAYQSGANSFLSKPSNPDALPDLIKSVVEYWLRKNIPHADSNQNVSVHKSQTESKLT